MKAGGLDLSLTSTGIATVHNGCIRVTTMKSTGSKDATLAQRRRRINDLAGRIIAQLWHDGIPPELVAVEGPSLGQGRQTGGQHDRAGLWWMVVDELIDLGLHVVEIAPAARAKYATGKGNASKDAVLAAVVRRYVDVEVGCNDEADACVLAAMAARHLGDPFEESLPATHLEAMAKVRWPARETAA